MTESATWTRANPALPRIRHLPNPAGNQIAAQDEALALLLGDPIAAEDYLQRTYPTSVFDPECGYWPELEEAS